MALDNFIVNDKATVLDVLSKIDQQASVQTVIVLDGAKQVIGTITDGDIRRGFLRGLTLENSITDFVHKDYSYLQEGDNNFGKLKEFRTKKLKAVPYLDKKGYLLKIYDFTKIKSILPIDAVIMAGGIGKRLRPLTEATPKPLLKIGNKEIIAYNFDRLYQYGVVNQHVTVNYLGDKVEEYCLSYNRDIKFNIVKEQQFLGTAGALTLIDHFENDVVLLINSDLLTNIDYEDFYISFISNNADIMVASVPYQVSLPYAILEADDQEVNSFKEKPNYTYHANAGIYLLKKDLIKMIPKGKVHNATDLMSLAIRSGRKLMHYPIRGYWLDIGKHDDYEKAQKDIAHINWD